MAGPYGPAIFFNLLGEGVAVGVFAKMQKAFGLFAGMQRGVWISKKLYKPPKNK